MVSSNSHIRIVAIVCLFVHWIDYFFHHYSLIIPNRLVSDMCASANIQANNSETSVLEGVC